jgi:tetratricopeptide (TPR) repeat protein
MRDQSPPPAPSTNEESGKEEEEEGDDDVDAYDVGPILNPDATASDPMKDVPQTAGTSARAAAAAADTAGGGSTFHLPMPAAGGSWGGSGATAGNYSKTSSSGNRNGKSATPGFQFTTTLPKARSDSDVAAARDAKNKGNEYYECKMYREAIQQYTQAIMLSPEPVYFNNRAAAYLMVDAFEAALADAKSVRCSFLDRNGCARGCGWIARLLAFKPTQLTYDLTAYISGVHSLTEFTVYAV